MDNLLPVYRHPVLTVLIDDNQDFLDSLAFRLDSRMTCVSFRDPSAAIDWLHDAYQSAAKNNGNPIRVNINEEGNLLGEYVTSIDANEIAHAVLNPLRFNLPAVLVIDYAMPQINGVEFCQAIRGLPCKKILLTGYADEAVAVDAFNRNLIDRFIKKGDPQALDHLETEIIKLQDDFFVEHSNTLTDILSRHCHEFLTDPEACALIKQIANQYGFVEFYLFAHPSGILYLDAQGKCTLMVIETQAGMSSHFDIAQDQGAPAELLSALRESQLVPFFSDTGGVYQAELHNNWMSYCAPSQLCRGKQDYYWSLFELPQKSLPGAVYSYAEFLRDRTNQKS